MAKIKGLIRMIRPVNCVMMGSAVIIGALVASNLNLNPSLSLVLGFFVGFLLLASANTINDYYDREVDAVNEPTRPIPSGEVKPEEALIFAFVLSAFGLILSFTLGIQCFVLSLLAWAISMYYATKGKEQGLIGNAMVSTCVAIPFIYGSLITRKLNPLVVLFSLMAFLSNMGREVNKGIVDIEGDKLRNVKTMAITRGTEYAARVSALFYISAVIISIIPQILRLTSWLYIPTVVAADMGFIYSSIKLMQNSGRENARKVKNQVLIWMCVGLVAFIVGMIQL